MGIVGNILGMGRSAGQIGDAVGGVAEIFVGNRAERELQDYQRQAGAVAQYAQEFTENGNTLFDSIVNGLNRLPRPMLALGTIGLFVYAMAEPGGFALRMEGLAIVPEPLWWLLGAIVSFYFGARELHHQRSRSSSSVTRVALPETTPPNDTIPAPLFGLRRKAANKPEASVHKATLIAVRAEDPEFNAAIEEWRQTRSTAA